ncbi:MAG TPA: SMI1/KNR4 family protein [Candidatus Limnocylindrales bacterium]|nr:SMI1/KNR4 family protein [Candidatus Limnocylindrales bacterium]
MIVFEDDDDEYTGAPLTSEMVRHAEEVLGVRLPRAYVDVLLQRNGGVPQHRCFPTEFTTSWAPDHIEIEALLGIGGEWGIDTLHGEAGIIAEWGYPEIGVVFCDTPSGGHDTLMLDYSECGAEGEPAVAYIDEDRIPRHIARTFDEFMARLVSCEQFEDDEQFEDE